MSSWQELWLPITANYCARNGHRRFTYIRSVLPTVCETLIIIPFLQRGKLRLRESKSLADVTAGKLCWHLAASEPLILAIVLCCRCCGCCLHGLTCQVTGMLNQRGPPASQTANRTNKSVLANSLQVPLQESCGPTSVVANLGGWSISGSSDSVS